MENYISTADMLLQMQGKQGWVKNDTDLGFVLIPPPNIATGQSIVLGDPNTCCLLDTDIALTAPLLERYYYKQKCIQVSLVDGIDMEFYQDKSDTYRPSEGLFCMIANIPQVWFHRHQVGSKQKVLSVVITEQFFIEQSISFSQDDWDRIDNLISGKIFNPKIELILKDLKTSKFNKAVFNIMLRAKALEILALLLDYTSQKEEIAPTVVLSKRSKDAAKQAILILNENYINPPIVTSLAVALEVDASTLQKAFKQLTRQTVYDYIVALRMNKALSLFEDTSLSIENIAKAVGYQSKVNFYKAFEKTYNCKPNELRKQILNG